jgi:hypothetical protein
MLHARQLDLGAAFDFTKVTTTVSMMLRILQRHSDHARCDVWLADP